jgi:hypothetical protein
MERFQHEEDESGRCSIEGHNAELVFCEALNRYDGQNAHLSTTKQEQWRGIDVIAKMGTIDVKARKRENRWQKYPQDKYIWVEFKNVGGGKGWIYSDADYLAFERKNDFVVVRRYHFSILAELLCDLENITDKASQALYRGYQRKDREDMIAKLKMDDILDLIDHKILKK